MLLLGEFIIPDIDVYQIVPILVLGLLLALTLCLELKDELLSDEVDSDVTNKPAVFGLGALALTGLLAYYVSAPAAVTALTFNGMVVSDILSRASGIIITVCCLLALLAGPDELERHRNGRAGEFCALLFASSLGMVLMASSANTILMFLGLELFSLALYLLCLFFPDDEASRESGMKYFLLSSAASAVLLYGLALLYGATGTTWLFEMQASPNGLKSGLAVAGTGMVLCGLLFKLAAVPFHFWAPDVYEGAPTTVTGYMSVATKVAALAATWRLVNQLGDETTKVALLIMFSLAILSMLVGNFLALAQTNVKRMLAYSGVANAGYLLIAPIVGLEMLSPMLFFLASYLFANFGAFIAVSQLESILNKKVDRKDLKGTFQAHPMLAGCFAICLVSLAGLPPTGGFMAKFFLFGKSLEAGQLILPVLGVAGSLVGAAYYLGTAITLFAKPVGEEPEEADDRSTAGSSTSQTALVLCTVCVLALGLMPSSVLQWLSQ